MDKQDTGQRVAEALFDFERALDHALAKGATAVAVATQARGEIGASLKVGAGAITKMAAASHTLAGVRETVAEAHHDLEVAQRAVGIRTNMTGGGDKPPSPDSVQKLRAVDGESRAA